MKHSTKKPLTFVKNTLKIITLPLILLTPNLVFAQDYPDKPINLIVGYPPGGSNDIVARLIAPLLGKELNTNVVVDNKAGANGTIGASFVAKSKADGYTLLFSSASPLVLAPQTLSPQPFETPKDFKAINMVGMTPEAITVGPKVNISSLGELIEKAKTQEFTFGSAGTGGLPHLTIEMLKQASAGKIVHVPYKGSAPSVTDALAGHIHGVVQDLTPLYPYIKDGKLKALAVTSKDTVSFLPDVPTANTVLPNFEVVNWLGLFAPANTPDNVTDKLNSAIQKIVSLPEFQEQLERIAVIPQALETTSDFQNFIQKEYSHWGTVIKQAGLVPSENK